MNVTFDCPGWSQELLSSLHGLYLQGCHCDLVLVCADGKLQAHVCVLAAASSWVASELEGGEWDGPVKLVSLQDTPTVIAQYVLTFIYTGEMKVPLRHMTEFHQLASKLRIKCMENNGEDDLADTSHPQDSGEADFVVRVADSSLPPDTVVTLNMDCTEGEQYTTADWRLADSCHTSRSVVISGPSMSPPSSSIEKEANVSRSATQDISQSQRPGRGILHKTPNTQKKPNTAKKRGQLQRAASSPVSVAPSDGPGERCAVSSIDSQCREGSLTDEVTEEAVPTVTQTQRGTAEIRPNPLGGGPDLSPPSQLGTDYQPMRRKRQSVYSYLRGKDGDYYCPECGKSYSASNALVEHRRRDHRKDFRYTCSVCGQGFMSKASWNSHYLKHLNVRAFSCQQCDKTFIHKKDLKQHVAFVHRGEQTPTPCPKCGALFKWDGSLRQHIKHCVEGCLQHCPHCTFTSKYQASIYRHRLRTHKDLLGK